LAAIPVSVPKNKVLADAELTGEIGRLTEVTYAEGAQKQTYIYLICRNLFLKKIPIVSRALMQDALCVLSEACQTTCPECGKTNERAMIKYSDSCMFCSDDVAFDSSELVIGITMRIDISVSEGTFSVEQGLESLHFNNLQDKGIIALRNGADSPLFLIAEVTGELEKAIQLSYECQSVEFNASQLVLPGAHIPIQIVPRRRAPSGTHAGEIHIVDSFGRVTKIPLRVTIDLPDRSLLGRLRRRKKQSTQERIEDFLISHAARNGGVLSKEEAFEVAGRYPAKDVLLVLQRLEEEGLVEREHGVYIFKQLLG